MRVILKPGGLTVILSVIALLSASTLFYSNWSTVNAEANLPSKQNLDVLKKARENRSSEIGRGLLASGVLKMPETATPYATLKELPKDEIPPAAAEGYHFSVTTKPPRFHDVQLRIPVAQSVAEGRTVTLHLWARSPKGDKLSIFMGERDADYSKAFFVSLSPPTEWKQYVYTFSIPVWRPGKAEVRIAAGHNVGEVDIAGFGLN